MIIKPDDKDSLDDIKKAGRIAAQAREYAITLVKVGASLLETSEKIEQKIIELGGQIAFPAQISRNSIAAHYCSSKDDTSVFMENDLVKIDLGVHVNGFVGDTAISVDLSSDKRYEKLILASSMALKKAISLATPGRKVCEIGCEISKTIESYGYKPIKNLSGHGIGKYHVHESPSIPNYDNGDETILVLGQTVAIEPFATTGDGFVKESGIANIFCLRTKQPTRNIIVRQVLSEIEKNNGLPFSLRQISSKYPAFKLSFALRELKQKNMIIEYPPLVESKEGIVSQTEHSLIVLEKPFVLTR